MGKEENDGPPSDRPETSEGGMETKKTQVPSPLFPRGGTIDQDTTTGDLEYTPYPGGTPGPATGIPIDPSGNYRGFSGTSYPIQVVDPNDLQPTPQQPQQPSSGRKSFGVPDSDAVGPGNPNIPPRKDPPPDDTKRSKWPPERPNGGK